MGEIAGDTCNFPTNMQIDERSALGRAACKMGISAGALMKQLYLIGAEQMLPALAEEIKQIRESRFIDKCAIVLAFVTVNGVLLLSLSADQRNQLPRRLSVRANRVKEIEA